MARTVDDTASKPWHCCRAFECCMDHDPGRVERPTRRGALTRCSSGLAMLWPCQRVNTCSDSRVRTLRYVATSIIPLMERPWKVKRAQTLRWALAKQCHERCPLSILFVMRTIRLFKVWKGEHLVD
ncbi:hypothetical protein H310_14471 [Aphanomyces invadans]|uniref:Uncharacterized protein n=1 Tax=Aphanomyces invadans TaxID=157072 RepID=A0A024TBT0_9STRA|nr:hypothetical protein H310_14471 [Aphanomyces invadans]ETV90802.1 hypothetical protein H310_14471 [Aphanomyces invadans]|eukprot:XP_008880559.1 hypothetical protein H310_14471 [Aphanomyces invadans]